MGRLVKPERWAWNRALLAPEWRSMAEDLRLIVPVWNWREGQTDSGKLWQGEAFLEGTPVEARYQKVGAGDDNPNEMRIGEHGIEYRASSSHDYHYFISNSDRMMFSDTDEVTVFVYCEDVEDASTLVKDVAGIWDRSDIAEQQYLLSFYQNKPAFFIRQEDGTQVFAQAANTALNQYVAISGSARTDGEVAVWVDGVKATNTSDGTLETITTPTFYWMGRKNPNTTDFLAGHFVVAYVWGRALTDGEQLRLAADPFGLIRPNRFLAPEVTPQTYTWGRG